MPNYSFDIKNSQDKLNNLLLKYNEYLENDISTSKAVELSVDSWHLVDWVFEEFIRPNSNLTLENFREILYPKCPSLKLMHDIANGSKHSKLTRPKASIKLTRVHDGDFSNDDFCSEDFDTSRLEIELEDGTILFFPDVIEKVIAFWKSYFQSLLNTIPSDNKTD
jgi:hypothetical protein